MSFRTPAAVVAQYIHDAIKNKGASKICAVWGKDTLDPLKEPYTLFYTDGDGVERELLDIAVDGSGNQIHYALSHNGQFVTNKSNSLVPVDPYFKRDSSIEPVSFALYYISNGVIGDQVSGTLRTAAQMQPIFDISDEWVKDLGEYTNFILDNVADMKSSDLPFFEGQRITTEGYNTPGDGGGADYIFRETPPANLDEKFNHTLKNGYAEIKIKKNKFDMLQGGLSPDLEDNQPIFQAGIDLAKARTVDFSVGYNGLSTGQNIPEFKIQKEIDLTNYFADVDFGHIKLTPQGAFRAINTKAVFFKLYNVEVDYKDVSRDDMLAWGGLAIEINGDLPKTTTSEVVFAIYDNIIIRGCYRGIGLVSTNLLTNAGLVWQTLFRRVSVYNPLDYGIYIDSRVQTSTTLNFEGCHIFGVTEPTAKGYYVYNSSTVVFDNCSMDGGDNLYEGSVMNIVSQHCSINTFHLESHVISTANHKSFLLTANANIGSIYLFNLKQKLPLSTDVGILLGSVASGFFLELDFVVNQAPASGNVGLLKFVDCNDYNGVDLGVKTGRGNVLNYRPDNDRSFDDKRAGAVNISVITPNETDQFLKIFEQELTEDGYRYESDQITVSSSRGALNGGQEMHLFQLSIFQELTLQIPNIYALHSTDTAKIAMTWNTNTNMLELWVRVSNRAMRVNINAMPSDTSRLELYKDYGYTPAATVTAMPGYVTLT